MNYCTYITIYTGSKLPKYYLGSSSVARVNAGYRGSVSSKKFKDIWRLELHNNPSLFNTHILSVHDSRMEATAHELKMHKALDVVHDAQFINCALAAPNGFFGMDVSGRNHPMFGRNHSAEARKKMSEAKRMGHKCSLSAEQVQRRALHMQVIGKAYGKINGSLPCPEAHKLRLHNLKLGVTLSEQHRAKISVATRAALSNPCVRAKLSAKAKGRKRSPESIAATAAAHTGMKRSEETKAKMKAAWQRRKQLKEKPSG